MITYEQAMTANHFEHVSEKNADGTPVRARRNGRTQIWKTRPGAFSIPVKYGMSTCFRIMDGSGTLWTSASQWEAK